MNCFDSNTRRTSFHFHVKAKYLPLYKCKRSYSDTVFSPCVLLLKGERTIIITTEPCRCLRADVCRLRQVSCPGLCRVLALERTAAPASASGRRSCCPLGGSKPTQQLAPHVSLCARTEIAGSAVRHACAAGGKRPGTAQAVGRVRRRGRPQGRPARSAAPELASPRRLPVNFPAPGLACRGRALGPSGRRWGAGQPAAAAPRRRGPRRCREPQLPVGPPARLRLRW